MTIRRTCLALARTGQRRNRRSFPLLQKVSTRYDPEGKFREGFLETKFCLADLQESSNSLAEDPLLMLLGIPAVLSARIVSRFHAAVACVLLCVLSLLGDAQTST